MFNIYLLTLKSYYLLLISLIAVSSSFEILLKNNTYLIFEYKPYLYSSYFISIVLYIVFEILFIKILNFEKLKYILDSVNKLIPLSMFILLIIKNSSLLYVLFYSKHSPLVTYIIFISILLELYFEVFILIGISKSYDLSIYKHKNKILNMQYDLQISNLKRLESKEEYIRKISHDINNHKIALHTLIENNEKEKALNYLKNLGVDSYKTNELYTKNKILNAILLSKKEICTLNNIDLSLDIKVPSPLEVSDFDLCIIFGNLLDNSIEATKKLKKSPYISVKAKIINSNLVLEVKNNYNGELVIKNNNIFTTKKDKLNHGFGISNIKSTVSKLNGIYEINKDSKEFSSIIMIPLEN